MRLLRSSGRRAHDTVDSRNSKRQRQWLAASSMILFLQHASSSFTPDVPSDHGNASSPARTTHGNVIDVGESETSWLGSSRADVASDVDEMAARVVSMDASTRGGTSSPTCASSCAACVATARALAANGTWPDIPYKPQPGVDTRSSWPVEDHLTRTETMAWCVHSGPTCCKPAFPLSFLLSYSVFAGS